MNVAEYLKTHADTLADAKTHKKAWLDLINEARGWAGSKPVGESDSYRAYCDHEREALLRLLKVIVGIPGTGPNGHTLYQTSDDDTPDTICDSNGEVVLGLCRVCGKGEIELDEPCVPTGSEGPVGEAVAFEFEWAPFDIEQWERTVSLRDPLVYGRVRRYRNVRPLYARPIKEPGEAVARRDMTSVPTDSEGSVGEAVAYSCEVLQHDDTWRLTFSETLPVAPNGGAIRNVRPLYAHPVDEPGEVDALPVVANPARMCEALNEMLEAARTERDEARALGAHETAIREEACRRADAAEAQAREYQNRATTAEAALAETRERLENLLEAMTSSEVGEIGRNLAIKDARNTLRAAVTGDAQEAQR